MSVFYVFQGKAYVEKLKDGFVLSPKLTKSKHQNIVFSIMTKIKKGDFIIHHCNSEIKAISITKSDCYDSTRTAYKMGNVSSWNNDDYRVDIYYMVLDTPVKLADHKYWLQDDYSEDSIFTKNGTGKQQYMCTIVEHHALNLTIQE